MKQGGEIYHLSLPAYKVGCLSFIPWENGGLRGVMGKSLKASFLRVGGEWRHCRFFPPLTQLDYTTF